jgi:hypothetical protein
LTTLFYGLAAKSTLLSELTAELTEFSELMANIVGKLGLLQAKTSFDVQFGLDGFDQSVNAVGQLIGVHVNEANGRLCRLTIKPIGQHLQLLHVVLERIK